MTKSTLATLASVLGLSALTGCSTVSTSHEITHVNDSARIVAIEEAASHTGTKIHWVNYPKKREVAAKLPSSK
jgi:ABC-type glycerol-3-phosphate transport system substrate-binding protein